MWGEVVGQPPLSQGKGGPQRAMTLDAWAERLGGMRMLVDVLMVLLAGGKYLVLVDMWVHHLAPLSWRSRTPTPTTGGPTGDTLALGGQGLRARWLKST